MSRRARRNHTPAFKAKVALAAIKGEMSPNWHSCLISTPVRSRRWKAQLQEGAADVFGSGNGAVHPIVDVKSLHAKIGALTLENDFFEGALGKAGLLSAKR
jgi:transposase